MPDYWTLHPTIVITWPGDLPGVAAIGKTRRNPDGTVSVQYTRAALILALEAMRELQRHLQTVEPLPSALFPQHSTVERPVFTRLSTRPAPLAATRRRR